VDYLTFGGIYREVALRVVPETHIENVFAQSVDTLTPQRRVDVRCYLNGPASTGTLTAELRDPSQGWKERGEGRRVLLLMDEFPILGNMRLFHNTISVMAGSD
jgi:beta-galactosidase/beta-glucuronidase